MKIHLHRRPLLAAAAVSVLGLIVSTVPNTVASASQSASASVDNTMYTISVSALDGDGGALANRLNNAGYDVISRTATTVNVLGSAATEGRLARVPGAAVVMRTNAVPLGPIPAAPANQDDILPKKLDGNSYPTFYGGYRTVAAYDQFESDLATAYPKLVQKVTYGTSFLGTNALNAVCITAHANKGCQLTPDVTKARFLLMAQIHAREIGTSEMAWRWMTRLIDGYKKDAQTTALLKSTEIWIVPQVNPDGIETVQDGITNDGTGANSPAWQRKNMDADQAPAGGCGAPWESSQTGIDLNRNNDYHWGGQGTSQNPCDQQYLGTAPSSEPETTAIHGLFNELFKDQRGSNPNDPAPANTTGAMVTMHSVAGLVLLPWSYLSTDHAPNDAQLRSMAFRQNYFNHYTAGQSGQVLYNAAGTSDDWTYATLGIASFTWELDGTGANCEGTFFPLYSCMNAYEANNLPGLNYDAAAARTPYKLALGPTVLSVTAKASGGSVKVTANPSDAAYGSSGVGKPAAQNVKAARIYVGKAPWAGGTAQAMSIQGSGTSVTATISVSPGAKKVLAYVQGQDADGNWGPAQAVWIPAS